VEREIKKGGEEGKEKKGSKGRCGRGEDEEGCMFDQEV